MLVWGKIVSDFYREICRLSNRVELGREERGGRRCYM